MDSEEEQQPDAPTTTDAETVSLNILIFLWIVKEMNHLNLHETKKSKWKTYLIFYK